MRPELERIKQRIRHGDISQDVLDALAKAVPTDSDFEEIMGGAPSDMDSFKEVATRIQRLEAAVGTGGGISPGGEEPGEEPEELEQMTQTVRFIDYDGTIINEIDLEDLPIQSFPQPPDHSTDFVPLTFRGWTTTLEKVNSSHYALDVGAQYAATDGNTHVIVEITESMIDNSINDFGFRISPFDEEITIDWGNGESVSIPAHDPEAGEAIAVANLKSVTTTYNLPGRYDVCISSDAQDVSMVFVIQTNNKSYTYAEQACIIGSNVQALTSTTGWPTIRGNIGRSQSLVIPDSVTSINGFSADHIKSLVIPNSVTIGNDAFASCASLQSLVIPDSVTSIANGAFMSCDSLQRLVIPDSVTSIGDSAFQYCWLLQSLVIPDSVTSIGTSAFMDCYSLKSLVIPSSITRIGNYAFEYLAEEILTIDSLSFVSKFFKPSTKRLVLGDSITTIGASDFQNCYSLQSLVIPDSVTSIGIGAFQSCYSLRSLVIPDSVIGIERDAFGYCYSLKKLIIGESVTYIDANNSSEAFEHINDAEVYIKQSPGNCNIKPKALLMYAEWGYEMDLVGFEIMNDYVIDGGDIILLINAIYKKNAEEGDHVLSKDVLNNLLVTCSDNATLNGKTIHALTDSGTVTVTVSINDGSGYSISKDLSIRQPSASVDLNDGQWVDTGEEVNGHTVYKSYVGLQDASNIVRCTLSVFGYSTVKIYARKVSSGYPDRVMTGNLNQTGLTTNSSVKDSAYSDSYREIVYNISDFDRSFVSTIEIVYVNGSGATTGSDGYFYFTVE